MWRVDVEVNLVDPPGGLAASRGPPQAGISGRWRRVDGETQFSSALPSLREVAGKSPQAPAMAHGIVAE